MDEDFGLSYLNNPQILAFMELDHLCLFVASSSFGDLYV